MNPCAWSGLDHLMHHGRRDPEKPPEVCFGRWHAVNLAVVLEAIQIPVDAVRESRAEQRGR
jgi:hypothetical protein